MKLCRIVAAFVLIVLMSSVSAFAEQKLSVAVAANFISAFKEMAADFEAKTKIKVDGTFSSTGNLYSQIINGAPYDLLLSADEERPARLNKDGLADKPFVYAKGQAVLWSASKDFCKAKTWQDALKNEQIKKISIANTQTAPYGAAAKKALEKAGMWDGLQNKLVNAQDIAQSFQYASTSAVDAGFCAMSATAGAEGKKGCFFVIHEAPEIIQSACILKRTTNRASVEKFVQFLSSPAAKEIKVKYGYR
ncbi:MAG: molybdate ABC transporter substrate-binding protein [Deltaproteobacteria bacterium HGW-Deltaproteobacteria-13]|jgi:molybdate transport system substrate-binding protein|nr:MAG: molybdate ABC transporter substrate-binding protein [Deltaproteobacteria bacterium HGW-Deltaproteobacteria-13]